jgi:transcriptional regulator with XRE-family HTH domain
MSTQAEVSEFLRTRRERLTPARAGLMGGGRRRVIGLRREEVAMLAGVSTDYYAKMERGNLTGVSADVLQAVARALQLDDAETAHLHDLAASLSTGALRRHPTSSATTVTPGLQRFLDAVTEAPVWVRDRRMDIVATNHLGRALLAPVLDDPASRGNNARFTFLSPAARVYYPDWAQGADSVVATLRSYAGQNPHDKPLTDLIGELVTRSDDFRVRWAAHNVRFHRSGTKHIHHPSVGDLTFTFEAMDLPAYPGWEMFAYTTEPGSPSEERVRLLGSLAASPATK